MYEIVFGSDRNINENYFFLKDSYQRTRVILKLSKQNN